MKILITGGAGYVGTELINKLCQEPSVEEIRVYDNLNRQNYNLFLGARLQNNQKVKFIYGDILDSRNLKRALTGIDVVYHLAAVVTTPFANTDPHFFEQVNHWGTAELTYAIEESSVSKFIYLSSIGVYGTSNKTVTEETIPNPKTFYGISKLRGEQHVERLMDKLDTIIVRSGNVYGYSKGMRFDAVINKFAFESNFNNRISIHGNGKQKRSFVHVNTISTILSRLASTYLPSDIYNLAERNLEVLDIVDAFKELIPDLEFSFINQHLNLREIELGLDLKIKKYIEFPEQSSFINEMEVFLKQFSF